MSNYPQNQKFDKPFLRKVIKEPSYGSGPIPHRAWFWCGAQKVVNWILDVIFPRICLGCERFTVNGDFDYVCKKCFSGVEIKNTLECVGCKREVKFGLICTRCRKENDLDQLLIASKLSDRLVNEMIKTYKYKFIFEMSKPLSVIARKSIKKLLNKGFNLFEDDCFLIPVPLHRTRLNERGFNQSWLIAKDMADTYFVPSGEDVLRKKYNFKHQAEIKTREERLDNVKNNFVIADPEVVKGKTVILIDDICTTGATLNECARVLKGSGAKRVIGFVIARGTAETPKNQKTWN